MVISFPIKKSVVSLWEEAAFLNKFIKGSYLMILL